jgi:hypothetical protein
MHALRAAHKCFIIITVDLTEALCSINFELQLQRPPSVGSYEPTISTSFCCAILSILRSDSTRNGGRELNRRQQLCSVSCVDESLQVLRADKTLAPPVTTLDSSAVMLLRELRVQQPCNFMRNIGLRVTTFSLRVDRKEAANVVF